jgi:DNA-binding beta-propeller fold protein YncE
MQYPSPTRGKTRRKVAGLVAAGAVVATGAASAGVALAAGPTLPTYTDSAYALPAGLPSAVQSALSTSAPTDIVYTSNDATEYVANGTTSVYAIPVANPAGATAITLSSASSQIAVAPSGSTLYAAETSADRIGIIALGSGNTETDVSTTTAPQAVAVSPNGSYLYATRPASVVAINLSTDVVTAISDPHGYLSAGQAAPSQLAVSPNGNDVYVAGAYGYGSAGVAVVDAGPVARLGAGAATVSDFITDSNAGASGVTSGLALSPDGYTLFVGDKTNASGATGTTVTIADVSHVSTDVYSDTAVGTMSGAPVAFNAPASLALTPNGGTLTVFGTGSTQNVTIPSAVSARPKASGGKKVGNTDTANATAVTGTTPGAVTLSYQWYANGVAIAGATSKTFKFTSAQYNKKIQVAVSSSDAVGYSSAPFESYKTSAIGKGKLTSKAVSISGSPLVGKTVTAKFKAWTPSPVTMSYQWYANGKKIGGATKKSLKLTSGDLFKKISVKVTGKKTDFTTVTKTSGTKTVV